MINQFTFKYSVASLILVLLSACGGQDASHSLAIVNADTASGGASNTSQTVATNQSTAASTEASLNAQVAAGEITIRNFIGVYEPRIYYSVFPLVATQNVKTDFVVEGVNIPADAQLVFDSLICEAPTYRTPSGFNQKCTMAGGTSAISRLSIMGGSKLLGSREIQLIPATVEPLYTGNLTDSGVTNNKCYGAESTDPVAWISGVAQSVWLSCTSAEALALNPKQDGMIGRDVTAPAAADGMLGFSYSNVPKTSGGTYANTECVKDNITGLTWEGKTTSGARNSALTYTNFDSTLKAQKWNSNLNVFVNPTQADIDAVTNTVGYKNYVNSISLCGYTDWRLPTLNELDGLLNMAIDNSNIDTVWFPNDLNNNYWTTNDYQGLGESSGVKAWSAIPFSNYPSLGIGHNFRDFKINNVKLVRGGATTVISRYSYLNNGTEVFDSKTNLIWRRCMEGMAWNGSTCIGTSRTFKHEQALSQANAQTGWRLPSKKELLSLIDFSLSASAIDLVAFPTRAPYDYNFFGFWSSTPDPSSPSNVFFVNFMTLGSSFHTDHRYFGGHQVLLVRNAP